MYSFLKRAVLFSSNVNRSKTLYKRERASFFLDQRFVLAHNLVSESAYFWHAQLVRGLMRLWLQAETLSEMSLGTPFIPKLCRHRRRRRRISNACSNIYSSESMSILPVRANFQVFKPKSCISTLAKMTVEISASLKPLLFMFQVNMQEHFMHVRFNVAPK